MAKTVEISQTVGGANEWRRARRPEHKLVRKEAILAAARYLVDTEGVEGTTLSDIPRRIAIVTLRIVKPFCFKLFWKKPEIGQTQLLMVCTGSRAMETLKSSANYWCVKH